MRKATVDINPRPTKKLCIEVPMVESYDVKIKFARPTYNIIPDNSEKESHIAFVTLYNINIMNQDICNSANPLIVSKHDLYNYLNDIVVDIQKKLVKFPNDAQLLLDNSLGNSILYKFDKILNDLINEKLIEIILA